MDNGASSYRRFRDEGDESGLVEIIRDYKDGLIFYLNGFEGKRSQSRRCNRILNGWKYGFRRK